MKVTPLWGYVVIRPSKMLNDDKNSPIVAPESSDYVSEQGEVIAVSEYGTPDGNGSVIPIVVKVGDKVFFNKGKREELKVNGEYCYVVDQLAVMAVISE